MKNYIYILLIICLGYSCDSYEELQDNPNKPSQVSPDLILSARLVSIFNPGNTIKNSGVYHNQFIVSPEPQYGTAGYDFGRTGIFYDGIFQCNQMEKEALRIGSDNMKPYLSLSKLFKAYYFSRMSLWVGDIPMSDAMKGGEGNFTPKYDTQKQVFMQCLQMLKEVNDELAEYEAAGYSVNGDMVYKGNLSRWRKFANSYRLRLLIQISKRASDPDLKLKEQFEEIYNGRNGKYPVISTLEDAAQWIFLDKDDHRNRAYHPNGFDGDEEWNQRYGVSSTIIDFLKEWRDPRLFILCEPADGLNSSVEGRETMFSSYEGMDAGNTPSTEGERMLNGEVSRINRKKYITPVGEPGILLGLQEVEFAFAEGLARGWTAGNAETHYMNGIKASMKFYEMNQAAIDTYFADVYATNVDVAYKGDTNEGIQQILEQKYVAFFCNSNWEPFYNIRRTGTPELKVGPANKNDNRIAKRWLYPIVEYDNNETNLREALQRQFNGEDDRNGLMWILRDE